VTSRCVCGNLLDGSPSDYFCSEDCQRKWSRRISDPRLAEVTDLIKEIMDRQRCGLSWSFSVDAPSRVL
jgi:hypothetical protein